MQNFYAVSFSYPNYKHMQKNSVDVFEEEAKIRIQGVIK
jgi:hypothetical protein